MSYVCILDFWKSSTVWHYYLLILLQTFCVYVCYRKVSSTCWWLHFMWSTIYILFPTWKINRDPNYKLVTLFTNSLLWKFSSITLLCNICVTNDLECVQFVTIPSSPHSSLITQFIKKESSKTGDTIVAGTAYPSGTTEFTSVVVGTTLLIR